MLGVRQLAAAFVVGGVVLALLMVATFARFQSQQDALAVEQEARAVAVCDSTVQGRATQLVFADVLIAAAERDDDVGQAQQIAVFRAGLEDRLLGELPATCAGVMSLAEFDRRVRGSASETVGG